MTDDRAAIRADGRARLLVPFAAALIAALLPCPARAQNRAELEVEREGPVTTTRVELANPATPLVRVERQQGEGLTTHRVGALLPAPIIGLEGYVSMFLEDRPDRTAIGAAFELGRGVPRLGGSVESDDDHYAGAYLKLRTPNAEVAFGGGRRNGAWVEHGALYVKGSRWSAAIGGAHGADGVDFEHLAATWHPLERGGGPGARFIAERRSAQRYSLELMAADRATFNHFAVWGQYGVDQWPHRKTFEAVDDIMRYVRPPTFEHQYTAGVGILGARHEVRNGLGETTLDARIFPARLIPRPAPDGGPPPGGGARGYLLGRVLPGIMVGGFRETTAGVTTWVGQVDLPPFTVYGERPATGDPTYLFAQLRLAF